eukprot:CAMPEP_0196808386 /NCGR_PEP_ID=MMETSP1362-20130617/8363_1 /TAXON_ID=163516 /ORGANISM="Leptocylindrus danicus, Strain CCMP1856" /LENGTH=30 /DNA_ID= /DNA_START= /DNA_END= /DNA_ORIENTATION=
MKWARDACAKTAFVFNKNKRSVIETDAKEK